MPHCAVALLNNFLFANWYPDRLAGIVFYVNSWPHLRAQLDLEPSGYVATQLAYLTALLPALVCFPSPSTWCPANCADLSTNSFAFKPHSEIQDYGM
ncbi:unnamed protein product [Protopolystoma xenopodis]|uniref:Uncharacterized protein n=1 Tax=Protopolystoma xenopodis TaxID=117903 RepID=A0A448WN96_9PLAT|nr:unnamed protein product [Protopolystoma xenopodis]